MTHPTSPRCHSLHLQECARPFRSLQAFSGSRVSPPHVPLLYDPTGTPGVHYALLGGTHVQGWASHHGQHSWVSNGDAGSWGCQESLLPFSVSWASLSPRMSPFGLPTAQGSPVGCWVPAASHAAAGGFLPQLAWKFEEKKINK